MFQCETCKKDSPALVAGECYACIRLDPDKEARLRQHFLIFDVDDPPPTAMPLSLTGLQITPKNQLTPNCG